MPNMSVHDVAALADKKKPAFNVPWRHALMGYAAMFTQAAGDTALVQPCMLAAIVARESGGQNILQKGVPPGPGCGVGLCQITANVLWPNLTDPTYPNYGALLDPLTNLRVAAIEFLNPLLREFPDRRQAAFAAYNLGAGGVERELARGLGPDAWTTDHDYGSSVFTDWINFSAVSLGVDVSWAGFSF